MILINILKRVLLYPFGILNGLHHLGKNGSRDLYNKFRFKKVIIDKGCCIDNKSIIKPNVHILENCIINNSQIDSFSYMGKNCLAQNVSIGKYCSIANDVYIGLGKHPVNFFSTSTIFYKKFNTLKIKLVDNDLAFCEYDKITIGNDVWIGARSIIMDGVKIGHGSIIAANSVVTKDVPPYAIVAGIPAKIIKFRFKEKKVNRLLLSRWWENKLSDIQNMSVELNSEI